MARNRGLKRRIAYAYLFQAGLIMIAAIVGVYVAKIAIEEILIKNAIQEEQDFFWKSYRESPGFSLPHTKNLAGYFDRQQLPGFIQDVLPKRLGVYEIGEGANRVVVQVSQQNQKTLYLVYYRGQVDALIIYYGLAPLLIVLVILYLSLWAAYRLNRRTVSPFLDLAQKIDKIDLVNPDFSTLELDSPPMGSDNEIQVLSDATIGLGERILEFIERERNFTRDASHELRTPLTVINMAADIALSDHKLSSQAKQSFNKIKSAVSDISRLMEVFLLLAREDDKGLTKENVSILSVVESELKTVSNLVENKDLILNFHADHDLQVCCSSIVVSIIIRNLLRNAVLYTNNGSINLKIRGKSLIIEDSGTGIAVKDMESIFEPYHRVDNRISGYGIGLAIVKRLSQRFDWPIEVQSEVGKGTCFEVHFSDALVSLKKSNKSE